MKHFNVIAAAATFTLIFGGTAPAGAEDRQRGGFRQGHRFAHKALGGDRSTSTILEGLARRLDLTEQQKAQIAPILEDTRAEMRRTMEGTHAVLEKAKEEIAAVLNPEQKEKIKDMKENFAGAIGGFLKDRGPELRERAQNAGDEMRLRFALGSMELTEQQREKLKELQDRTRAEREAVMAEVQPRIEQIRENVKQELNSILTEEQRSELDQKMEQMPRHGHKPRRQNARLNP